MRRIEGALHAHAVIREQGRTPGDEGRAAIMRNREIRKRETIQAIDHDSIYVNVLADELWNT